MTRALETGPNAAILHANPKLTATLGPYSYEIAHSGDRFLYTVTDGKQTLQVPVEWAFGQGTAGQTYVFRREGQWYESRVSYFSALQGLDLTLGAHNNAPQSRRGRRPPGARVGNAPLLQLPRHQYLPKPARSPWMECWRAYSASVATARPMHTARAAQ